MLLPFFQSTDFPLLVCTFQQARLDPSGRADMALIDAVDLLGLLGDARGVVQRIAKDYRHCEGPFHVQRAFVVFPYFSLFFCCIPFLSCSL